MRARGKEVYCWLHMLSVKDRANRLQPASRLLCNIDSLAAATSKISRASFRSCTLPAPVVMAPMKAMKAMKARWGAARFWLAAALDHWKMQMKAKDSVEIHRTCKTGR